MSAKPLPRLLDLRKLTDHGGEVRGVVNLDQLLRLAEFAGSEAGRVEATLRFFRDEEGRRRIEGDVSVPLHLTCQRCLEPVPSDIHTRVKLVVVWSEQEVRELPEELEPWLAGEEPTVLADLLEEEILLALPLVALHEDCRAPLAKQSNKVAVAAQAVDVAARDNPFSVLAELKDRQD